MTKFYSSLLAIALAIPAMAQQIPNSGFEEGWKDCTPWTSDGNTKPMPNEGQTPENWTISHVIGFLGLGATKVGEKVPGYNESESAVKLFNMPNEYMPTQVVPGYITLGTTWSTSVLGSENDGGSFGGIEFTGRPVKITFMYKFEKDSENDQPANAIAYLWKGTYTQKDVPGCIGFSGTPKTVDMVNRDRNILGIETAKGGEVTKSEGAELIAEGKTVITETTSEWVKGEIVFDYKSDATPEMLNIIFAANDYFSAENITKGNYLTVDDVQAVYLEKEDVYKGEVVVDMGMGSPATTKASVYVKSYTDGSCIFELPDFTFMGANIGTISVPNVSVDKTNAEKYSYVGSVKNLKLMMSGQEIIADADLTGTTDQEGNADFKIKVVWHSGVMGDMNIDVTFTGKLESSGIENVEAADNDAPVEYYNLQGVRVSDPTPGLYIRRQGNNVSKVIIR